MTAVRASGFFLSSPAGHPTVQAGEGLGAPVIVFFDAAAGPLLAVALFFVAYSLFQAQIKNEVPPVVRGFLVPSACLMLALAMLQAMEAALGGRAVGSWEALCPG